MTTQQREPGDHAVNVFELDLARVNDYELSTRSVADLVAATRRQSFVVTTGTLRARVAKEAPPEPIQLLGRSA